MITEKDTPFTQEEKDEYLQSRMGTEGYCDDNWCDCATWTVGDHRCSCGNRRIDFWVAEHFDIKTKKYSIFIETEPY